MSPLPAAKRHFGKLVKAAYTCPAMTASPPYDLSAQLLPQEQETLNQLLLDSRLQSLQKALPNGDLYLVGGAIRDVLSGKSGSDLDLATVLTPTEAETHLTQAGIRVVQTGIRHGTLTTVFSEGTVEITTFRRPTGDHTSQYASTISEDISGRDFTINAFAYSLNTRHLFGPSSALEDLRQNILRSVGDPLQRFREDPLRILRGIRFGSADLRTVDPKTEEAMTVSKEGLTTVSPERIRVELCKILCSPGAGAAFLKMKELDLLKLFLPEILPSIGFEQNEFHIHDVFEHTIWVLERCDPKSLILRLSALFHDLGKPHTLSIGEDGRRHFYAHESVSTDICKEAMQRLRFSNREIEDVSMIVRYHMRPIDCGPSGVRRLMRDLGENFSLWREFKRADSPPVLGEEDFEQRALRFDEMVQEELDRLRRVESNRLALGGSDIIALGIPEGRLVGRTLTFLTELVIENPDLNDRSYLIERAREFLNRETTEKK